MRRPIAYEGHRLTIAFAVCLNGTSPGEEFFDALDDGDKAKLFKLFEYLGDHGQIKNEEKFKAIGHSLWEFKSKQIRMPCFYTKSAEAVVTHGFRKKQDKTPPAEIARALRIREEDKQNAQRCCESENSI